jgi:hypothetical protein
MTPRARVDGGDALRRFVDAVADLNERPTATNVARYLRASNNLDQATSKPSKPRSPRSRAGAPA